MPASLRYISIVVLASLLFFPFLGQVHLFDWDEINFAECAREMIVSHDYLRVQIDFQPFWEKPPLFIWLQVLSMKIFGVNEYAARFPNALTGVITLVTLFHVGKKVVNERMATWWVLLYAATWLPHFYFKTGIIDPVFNLFIFLAFYQVYQLRHTDRKMLHAILGGIFIGLAVLTKGPVALLVAMLALGVYIIWNKGFWGISIAHLAIVVVVALLTTGVWFGVEIAHHGIGLVTDFIVYQVRLFRTEDAGHGGPFYYHFIILLLGCFPASLFLFQYRNFRSKDAELQRDFTSWMWIMFWVVLILFSIVKTKIVHYSSLCYFPLTFLAALQVYKLSEGEATIKGWVRTLLLIIGSLVAIAITLLPVVGINKHLLIPYIDDPFAVGNFQSAVHWGYAEAAWGLLYLAGIIAAVVLIKKQFAKGMLLLCAVQLVIIQVTVIHFTPKIEAFSQRAAIEYFESLKGKDAYVQVLGYKSYAHLFYTDAQPHSNKNYYDTNWLLWGEVDKPTYFICKIMDKEKYLALPQIEYIGEKNGFVFMKRK
ncbi:MAG: glycosyltransferase family 39 protein [Sphingobacteriales bacterium]|nr:MAG: glycosyltransferase family 39 protein [Sphingobacteriales bacterium]